MELTYSDPIICIFIIYRARREGMMTYLQASFGAVLCHDADVGCVDACSDELDHMVMLKIPDL